MRHNLLCNVAALAFLAILGATFGMYLFSRRLWRSPLAWLCLALAATIIYGVTCSYARISQVHHIFQLAVSRVSAWFTAGQHSSATQPWALSHFSSLQLQKAGHTIFFALLAITVCLLVWQRRPLRPSPHPSWRLFFTCLGTCTALTLFATATELLQSVTPEREPKVADWLLNLQGLGIGVLLVGVFFGFVRLGALLFSRRRRRQPAGAAPGAGG